MFARRMTARRTPPGAAALLLVALAASTPPARALALRTLRPGPPRPGPPGSITAGPGGTRVAAVGPRAGLRRPRPSGRWALASSGSGVEEEAPAAVNGIGGAAGESAGPSADGADGEEKSEEERRDEEMMGQAIMMANSAGGERGSRESRPGLDGGARLRCSSWNTHLSQPDTPSQNNFARSLLKT